MGLDVHQIYASNDSLHPPRHLLFLLHCCVLPSLSLSLHPQPQLPGHPSPISSLLCFISAFPFLPLLAYPLKKKVKMAEEQ